LFFADVSGQPVGSIFKGQVDQEFFLVRLNLEDLISSGDTGAFCDTCDGIEKYIKSFDEDM
jgi:hypothetical protein